MPRPIWTGSITFGLVNVPVELRSIEKREDLSFTLLDKRDLSPIGYQKINKGTGDPVPSGDVVRGYEYEERRFVVVEDEELEQANVKATHTIEIVSFVGFDEIDPMYFDRPYVVAPGKAGVKAYALLAKSLASDDTVGVAKVVLRNRQHLSALYSRRDLLILQFLRYAHELADLSEIDLPTDEIRKAKVSEQEMKLASQLIEGMRQKWDPAEFRDDYRDDVLALIDKKAKAHAEGRHFVVARKPYKGKSTGVIDLMSVLRDSVAQAKKHGTNGAAPMRKPGPRGKRRMSA